MQRVRLKSLTFFINPLTLIQVMKSIAIILWSLLFFDPVDVTVEKWIVEKQSNLSIEGKSNVNTFKCNIVEYLNQDTIFLYKDLTPGQRPMVAKGGVNININRFDCHQNHITADLKKTLKAKENAFMKISLLTLGFIKPNSNRQHLKGHVEIRLAGITRKIEVDYAVMKTESGILNLVGTRTILFSDFGLTPPSKLAGLIKVEQEIKVRFELVLRSA